MIYEVENKPMDEDNGRYLCPKCGMTNAKLEGAEYTCTDCGNKWPHRLTAIT